MQSFEIQNNSAFNFISDNIILNSRAYNSEQNISFCFLNALSGVKDVKVNNYSSLFLTNRQNINNIFSPVQLNNISTTDFSSNLVFNAQTLPVYLAVNESAYNTNNVSTVSVVSSGGSNNNFFDVTFLDNFTCKISHFYQEDTRYLTVNIGSQLVFAENTNTDYLGAESPQIFYYVYDTNENLLVLYKQIYGISSYVTLNNGILQLQNISTNLSIPFNSIINVLPITNYQLPNNTNVGYNQDFNNNTININISTTRTDIPKAFLLHSEFASNTLSAINLNGALIKNSQTPTNNVALFDNFLQSDTYNYREYEKIFSGSKQETGDYNLSMGYDSYTTEITFKTGKITYFHIPYNLYPYIQLNINDSNLIYLGAIAGASPTQSDKVFKKRADYKYSSSFGQPLDENNGEYLCTWLSANNIKPTWIDRYYNPQTLTKLQALSATEPNTVIITDTFSNIAVGQPVFFDKISDLTFETGSLYAYHHLGQQDLQLYVNNLSGNQIATIPTTVFDGNTYINIPDITPIYNANQFTLAFDMYNDNWSIPFANQVLGNYIQNGFGIFNQNNISPFIYYWLGANLYIYNTDLVLLHTATFNSNIKGMFRKENLLDYYLILDSNQIIQVSTDQTEKFAVNTSLINFTSILYTTNNAISGAFIVNDRNIRKLLAFNFITYGITDYTNSNQVITLNSIPVNTITTVDIYNGLLYCTNSTLTQLNQNNIYHLGSPTLINRWELDNNTVYPLLSTQVPINHFNIDSEGYMWVLYGSKLAKLDLDKNIIFTQTLSTTNNINIDFISELTQGEFENNIIVTSQNLNNSITITKYDQNGNVITQSVNSNIKQSLYNINTSNGSYIRRVISPNLYNLNAIVSLQDQLNVTQFLYLNNTFPTLSSLGAGYHNFAVKLNTTLGIYSAFIDGINISTLNFTPNRYSLVSKLQKNMYIGAIPFYNGDTLSNYTDQSNRFLMGNVTIQNFHLYDVALSDSDINIIGNSNKPNKDISFQIFTGKRSFIDEVDSFYKMNVPGFVSNYYNLNIKNTNITNQSVLSVFEARILSRLQNIMPGYSDLAKINWT